MYKIDWNIEFKNPSGKKYRLALMYSVEIEKSVENLVDVARISVPESILNNVLSIESKIPRGTEVTIKMGYNANTTDQLNTEFTGYVREIRNTNGTLLIDCEDEIFQFRKPVTDVVLKSTSISKIVQRVIDECASGMKLSCDYDITYEKFIFHLANGFDVLKKLQEETKANIWIDSDTNTLHIHAPFVEKSGEVKLSPQKNLQSISLEYKRAVDRKFQVTVESVGTDGKIKSITSGSTGGETVKMKVGAMSESDMNKVADSELSKRMADRYEGSVDGWYLPIVSPTMTARYTDEDYPDFAGGYYVPAVKLSLSSSGIVRTTTFGIKTS